jgi:acetoin utilization deacetylase AcuC-like enzyme
VLDLDVHQGNGTAVLLADDPRVFTFSMHCAQNYPSPKERSDLDIALPAGTTEGPYLQALQETLPGLISKHQPDIIYYIAGADVLVGDRLGRLALTPEGLAERDGYVFGLAHQLGIPLVLTLGGGYNENLARMVNAQARTFELLALTYD